MDISFLKPLYDRPGPWCSVYLPTPGDQASAAHEIELRWRELRDRLAELGAAEEDLQAIDQEVGADRGMPAEHGRALFAAHGSVALVREMCPPVTRPRAVFGQLPDLVPLLAQAPDVGPYVVVFADRAGADVEVREDCAAISVSEHVQGPVSPLGKAPRGSTAPDHQEHRAEHAWQDNARAIAARVQQIAGEHGAGMIALSGDVRMRTTVFDELGPGWRPRTVELDGSDAPGADAEVVRQRAARAAAELEQAWRSDLADRYAAGLANEKAVEGLEHTVESLRAGDVDSLLVRYGTPDAGAPVWWGPEPGQLAVHPDELESTHASHARRGRAVDALIRAAALEGGDLLMFSGGEPGPRSSVGAILRRG